MGFILEKQNKFEKIGFLSSGTKQANKAKQEFQKLYGKIAIENADVVVALGGDGLMLQTLHRMMNTDIPIYGVNYGTLGFLMNAEGRFEDLLHKLQNAETTIIHPLLMKVEDENGEIHSARAINEVSLLRQSHQAAKLSVSIDNRVRLEELVCDGILVATPAGSTAYNLSAHGPILPINAPMLALTPISPYRPRRWRGALLPSSAKVEINVINLQKRPVNVAADNFEIRNIRKVIINEDKTSSMHMMFDPGHSLEERILNEQFYEG